MNAITTEPALPWTVPGWHDQVRDWVHAELARHGIAPRGPLEQPHIRPWSTVLRQATDHGDVFFKATAPVLAHEPALTLALARWRPDCTPAVLAADTARGWLLMPDAGPALRGAIQSVADLAHWRRVLPLYAGLQIEMIDRKLELLSLGTLDRRLETLAGQFETLLADETALRIGLPDGLSAEEYGALQALAPRVAEMCAMLTSYGIPETLHHDDFHDGNILLRGGQYVFMDWGESCVTHPFFTMVVTLRSTAYRLKLDADAPEITALRDAYLEPWTRYASRAELLAAFPPSQQLGMLNRVLTWYRVVSHLSGPDLEEHADAVPGWLQVFLEAVS